MRRASPAPRAVRSWQDRALLYWDLTVVALVAVNLSLIVFDTLFIAPFVAAGLEAMAPGFHAFYDTSIHANFLAIDLCFVAVFILDVLGGWAVAVYQQRYHRWFFYPFVHWYDVLGCIPLTGFRWLRVLRVISLGFRLQRMRLIDVRGWYLYAVLAKYYNILMEELSDRVVVNVLGSVQDEVRGGGGELPARVVREIVAPRKEALVQAISTRLDRSLGGIYHGNRAEIQGYVGLLVEKAVARNAAVRNLERVPMLGGYVTHLLEDAIKTTVYDVLDEAVQGLESVEFDDLVRRLTDTIFERVLAERETDNREVEAALVEVIDLLKEQVQRKQWMETYA